MGTCPPTSQCRGEERQNELRWGPGVPPPPIFLSNGVLKSSGLATETLFTRKKTLEKENIWRKCAGINRFHPPPPPPFNAVLFFFWVVQGTDLAFAPFAKKLFPCLISLWYCSWVLGREGRGRGRQRAGLGLANGELQLVRGVVGSQGRSLDAEVLKNPSVINFLLH